MWRRKRSLALVYIIPYTAVETAWWPILRTCVQRIGVSLSIVLVEKLSFQDVPFVMLLFAKTCNLVDQ